MSNSMVVTGAAGFIGSHLVTALQARGHHVVGIDNFDSFYDRNSKQRNVAPLLAAGCEFIEADICNRSAMEAVFTRVKPAGVFHIAALAGVRPSIENPQRYAAVNVDGLINVLDAARQSGCRRIVFASSSSVYGNNSKVPFAEDDRVDEPISPYAATKRAGELICHSYAHLFDLSIAALRFFTVFGPAQRPDLAIAKFMRLIDAGDEIPMFGDGSTSRDYTFIDDIIAGVLAAYDRVDTSSSEFFRTWNLGNSRPVTLADMIESIAKVVGKPAQIQQHPMQPGDVERTWADVSRSEKELGYHPSTKFVDGLARQWEWWKHHRGNLTTTASTLSES